MTCDDAIEMALLDSLDFQRTIRARSRNDDSGCWLWVRPQTTTGYGTLRSHKTLVRAHRVSWAVFNGRSPRDLCICHSCDTPLCVNPDHLFIGTRADNNRDMAAKGRRANAPPKNPRRGESASWSVLTEAQVIWIRKQRRGGLATCEYLGKILGISRKTIFNASAGVSWKHLNDMHPPATSRPWGKKGD